jgi:hypothetical protein
MAFRAFLVLRGKGIRNGRGNQKKNKEETGKEIFIVHGFNVSTKLPDFCRVKTHKYLKAGKLSLRGAQRRGNLSFGLNSDIATLCSR